MRLLSELLDNLTTTIRLLIGTFVLCGFLFGLFTTVGFSYVAPKVAEQYGERAVQIGERAMAEARAAERERALAKEGWGYGAATAGTVPADTGGSRPATNGAADDWGEGTE
jgi:hypothetical protein